MCNSRYVLLFFRWSFCRSLLESKRVTIVRSLNKKLGRGGVGSNMANMKMISVYFLQVRNLKSQIDILLNKLTTVK